MDKIDFDDYAENYSSLVSNQLRFFDKNDHYFAEYKINKIKNILHSPPSVILDFGCGIGTTTYCLQKHFPNASLYGYDISDKSLCIAEKHVPGAHFIDDIKKMNESCDLIFMSG